MIDWRRIYEEGNCPDCFDTIPRGTEDGEECANCGHIFWIFGQIVPDPPPSVLTNRARAAYLETFYDIVTRTYEIDGTVTNPFDV